MKVKVKGQAVRLTYVGIPISHLLTMFRALNQEKAIIVKSSRRFVWSSSGEVWGRWSPRRATAGCWVDQGSYNITTSSQHHHQQQHCSGAPRWWGQEEKELVTREQWQLFVGSPPLLRPTLAGGDIFTSTLLAGAIKTVWMADTSDQHSAAAWEPPPQYLVLASI